MSHGLSDDPVCDRLIYTVNEHLSEIRTQGAHRESTASGLRQALVSCQTAWRGQPTIRKEAALSLCELMRFLVQLDERVADAERPVYWDELLEFERLVESILEAES